MATVIYNNIIPFKGSKAITIWPLIFARKSAKWLKDYEENHEKIHLRQQFEVLIISFMLILMTVLCLDLSRWLILISLLVYYAWYGLEWLIRFAIYHDTNIAYKNISFEQEAYVNQYDMNYLNKRGVFAWAKFIVKKTYNT